MRNKGMSHTATDSMSQTDSYAVIRYYAYALRYAEPYATLAAGYEGHAITPHTFRHADASHDIPDTAATLRHQACAATSRYTQPSLRIIPMAVTYATANASSTLPLFISRHEITSCHYATPHIHIEKSTGQRCNKWLQAILQYTIRWALIRYTNTPVISLPR